MPTSRGPKPAACPHPSQLAPFRAQKPAQKAPELPDVDEAEIDVDDGDFDFIEEYGSSANFLQNLNAREIDAYLTQPRQGKDAANKRRKTDSRANGRGAPAGVNDSDSDAGSDLPIDSGGEDADSGDEQDGLEARHKGMLERRGQKPGTAAEDDDDAAPLPVKTMEGGVLRAPKMTARARAALGRASEVQVEGIIVTEDEKVHRIREQMAKEEERARCRPPPAIALGPAVHPPFLGPGAKRGPAARTVPLP